MAKPYSFGARYIQKKLLFKFLIDFTFQWTLIYGSDADLHLDLGKKFLLNGQLNDALSHYHLAVENDATNYITYFERSTVYQALGRYKSALDDLSDSLKLNPNFLPARFQRALVFFRKASFDEAKKDLEYVLKIDSSHHEAIHYYSQIDILEKELNFVKQLIETHNYHEAIEILTKLLQDLYWSVKLRELRAESYEQIGDVIKAIGDLRAVTKMTSDNTEGFLKLSKLHYLLGEPDESLNAIRECLKLDPDHKECQNHYKKVKKLSNLYRSANDLVTKNDYSGCIEKLNAALKVESNVPKMMYLFKSKQCHCLNMNGNAKEAIQICTEAHDLNPNDPNVLCDRADSHINLENFDDASIDYKKAHQVDEQMSRAKDGYNKAERLKKQSKKRDYYKILGVSRTATKKEIMKSYRKLASKWHPDLFQGDEKKKAEKVFIDIAAAKEVLTNEEKRQKFDNGEDPLDPEQQNGNGFHPFTSGFNPFGSNSYTFRFTF